jgi:hypothetical protein
MITGTNTNQRAGTATEMIVHFRRHFRTIAASDMTPTAKPTQSDATRRCHSICSWKDVTTPITGEAMPTMGAVLCLSRIGSRIGAPIRE